MTVQGSSCFFVPPVHPPLPAPHPRRRRQSHCTHSCTRLPRAGSRPARTRHNAYLNERVRTWTQNPAHDSKLCFNRRKPISWQNGRRTSRLASAVSDPTGPAEAADLLRAAGCEPPCACLQTEQHFPLGSRIDVSVSLSHSDLSPPNYATVPPSCPGTKALKCTRRGSTWLLCCPVYTCPWFVHRIMARPFVAMHLCQRQMSGQLGKQWSQRGRCIRKSMLTMRKGRRYRTHSTHLFSIIKAPAKYVCDINQTAIENEKNIIHQRLWNTYTWFSAENFFQMTITLL